MLKVCRAPPPVDSKPEAANFPSQTYDMSTDTQLFQPPTHYPDAPKDMWYQVPEKAPEPEKPKPIFPWELTAPKPTRVFPKSRSPSPPPFTPPASTLQPAEVTTPSAGTDITDTSEESVTTPTAPTDPWAAFQQRTNVWDDMPEIERYVQAIHQGRKGRLQVLHHTPSQRSPTGSTVTSPPTETPRRASLKLTDFPTEVERPSLPVTPAPIRRPSFWGEDRDEDGDLPAAEGVPKQEDWVRRSSSYPAPAFPALPSPLHPSHGVLYWRCQFCGRQNPITKLEELRRRQSEVLLSPTGPGPRETTEELPLRKMPESQSKEAAVEAAILSISPTKTPKVPKPILKAPHFELGQEPKADSDDEADAVKEGVEDQGPKAPAFNPVALVGEAASSSKGSSAVAAT